MKKVYLIATFVAIIAGIATYFFASQISKSQKIENIPTASVVVAKEAINENTTLTAEMLEVRVYTKSSILPGAASTIEEVVGKLNRYPLVKDEQINTDNLITKGVENKDARLSYQLLPGEYAYAIPVDVVQGVAGFISPGDRVDILHTGTVEDTSADGQIVTIGNIDDKGVIITQILMKDIKVLKISDYAANVLAEKPLADGGEKITSYSVVTLLLNEAQVIQLTQMQSVGRLMLALKPIDSVQTDSIPLVPSEQTEQTTAAAS